MATPAAKKNPDTEAREIDFKGTTVTLPAANDIPLDVIELAEEGQVIGAVKALLGDEQYAELRKTVLTTSGDLEALMSHVQDGADLPN